MKNSGTVKRQYVKSYINDGKRHTYASDSYFLYYGQINNILKNDEIINNAEISNYIIFYNNIQQDKEKNPKSSRFNYKYFSDWFLNYIFNDKTKPDFEAEKNNFKAYLANNICNIELRNALDNNTGIFIIDTTQLKFDKDNTDIKFNFYPY